MNLRTLKYLIAVVDHQHFSKAAEACFVSQPTLSMQLKKLEDDLGVQLIERKNKKILVTPLAKQLADHGRRILNEVTQLKKTANYFSDPYSAEINLGILPTIAPYLLPHIMPALKEQLPKLELHIQEDLTKRLKKKLIQGELDAIIIADDVAPAEIENLLLYEEPFQVLLPVNHKIASKKHISTSDLKDQNLLLLHEEHCLRQQIEQFCFFSNTPKNQNFKASSLETIRQLVANGYGVTLMPKLACLERDPRICYQDFQCSAPKRPISLLWRKTAIQKNLFEDLAKLIKTNIEHLL